MEKHPTYVIQVQDEMGERWSVRLKGMSIAIDREQRGVTTPVNPLRDQPALNRMLSMLRELHLRVLSVGRLEGAEE